MCLIHKKLVSTVPKGRWDLHRHVTVPIYVECMSLSLPYTPTVECSLCDDDLVHCHGTAIVTSEDSHVCSDDPDCTLSVNEYWFMSIEDDETSLR